MGVCKFCGEDAGISKCAHFKCGARDTGIRRIITLVSEAVGRDLKDLESRINMIARGHYVSYDELPSLKLIGWEDALLRANKSEDLDENTIGELALLASALSLTSTDRETMRIFVITRLRQERRRTLTVAKSKREAKESERRRKLKQQEAERQRKIQEQEAEQQRKIQEQEAEQQRKIQEQEAEQQCKIQQEDAEHQRILQAEVQRRKQKEAKRRNQESVINAIRNGRYSQPNLSVENTPFNLQRSENLVWVFKNTMYQEERVKKRRTHRSHGVSPTVYGMETVGTGTLGLTTKHIYFVSSREQFRIRYNKIVTFKKFTDGIVIRRDSVNARTQRFITGDGWFTYGLIRVLARRF